jgi:hypothetical protein
MSETQRSTKRMPNHANSAQSLPSSLTTEQRPMTAVDFAGTNFSLTQKEYSMRTSLIVTSLGSIALAAVLIAQPLFAESHEESAPAATDQETEAKDIGQKSRGGGEDENIKSSSAANDPEAAPPAPPEKGGDKTRGSLCYLTVDNYTEWKIQVYVDRDYVGLVSSWGKSTGSYGGGSTRLYAVADFTDGTRYAWGPRVITCNGGYT